MNTGKKSECETFKIRFNVLYAVLCSSHQERPLYLQKMHKHTNTPISGLSDILVLLSMLHMSSQLKKKKKEKKIS